MLRFHKHLAFLIVALIPFVSCASRMYQYRIETKVSLVSPVLNTLIYEDECINIKFNGLFKTAYTVEEKKGWPIPLKKGYFPKFNWKGSDEFIHFVLFNKSGEILRIFWDQASFIDSQGYIYRVIHRGQQLKNRDVPQPTTVIPPGYRINDFLYPAENFRYDKVGGWKAAPLVLDIKEGYFKDKEEVIERLKGDDLIGDRFGLVLAVSCGEDVRFYTFIFEVEDIELHPVKSTKEGN